MSFDVDSFDRRLLDALQRDGALSNQALSEVIGLSPSQCSRRRQRLEEAGFIRTYRAELNAEQLGYPILVFTHVRLNAHNPANARHFRDLVTMHPQIQEAHVLTGDADYLLKLRVQDLQDLAHLIHEILLPHEAVAQVRSNIAMDTIKMDNQLPILS